MEHPQAIALVNEALESPRDWIVADQVLFEFYKALRNPRVFRSPLSASAAAERVEFLRGEIAHCVYEGPLFPTVLASLRRETFPYQRVHDEILATTLSGAGVRTFYTRNTKDFVEAKFEVINPIDEAS